MMEGGGYGGCGKQLRNCLSLSVHISHFCISLSLLSLLLLPQSVRPPLGLGQCAAR